MKAIPVTEAVGMVLGHDVTRIIPGQEKGPAFRKGHIIREDEIPAFLDMGKANIFVLDLSEGMLHEDEAAGRLARAATGPGLRLTGPVEGRINMIAEADGLLKIDIAALTRLNTCGQIAFATLHTFQHVTAGQRVAGVRIVPLAIEANEIVAAERILREARPLIQVKPFKSCCVGVVTTGSEVYHGRIKDGFGPVVEKKFAALGSRVIRQILVSDDRQMTVDAIHALIAEGAEMVMVTGGMSVDPDDQTPASIRAAGGRVIAYGAPIFPGAMFMLATIGDVPVAGLPGCVMYYPTSIFDLVIPRLLAGETVTRDDIAAMGHGGLCAGCNVCRYPLCGFGKGIC
ncbi:molybdopterin biosynthesis protein [Desulfosarcina ovata subsp. sediminis]|uniref:Molybdopterin molybdenumtransferase n=1 Tax=Desulfosarcina ovata subsp. sediminis TaxID=885957 RepID=A0A5K7ZX83_9BACT|nr:molybdopterin-binding protein [Desulfosarcina ovata]BBO84875.1 molybdopterin biosynthesis protein [Desulfosarcina ovata subsp. sediminis]